MQHFKILLITSLAMLAALAGCNGDSTGSAPFSGINQSYIVAGGERQLQLEGLSGTYRWISVNGPDVLPVVVSPKTLLWEGLAVLIAQQAICLSLVDMRVLRVSM